MGINKNYLAVVTSSLFVVSFFSSCGKSEVQDGNKPQNIATQELSENGDSDDNSGVFCTNLDDKQNTPLGAYQWHLKNTGQTAFASDAGVAGEDINVDSVLKDDCLSGHGVNVAVVDTGLEKDHPSLSPNYKVTPKTKSLNFRNNYLARNDPSPVPEDQDDHGTMVSGIIAMRSGLGFGGSGVAPRANLSGYNIIQAEVGVQTPKNFIDSLGGSKESSGNHIFSMSYGSAPLEQQDPFDPQTVASTAAYNAGVNYLRNGKGAIYVKAAGNGFGRAGSSIFARMACKEANRVGVSCQDSNMDYDNSLAEVITVGALNAKGKKTSYSTTGSSLWISAPGGEFGFDKAWVDEAAERMIGEKIDWENYRATLGEPAIVTTDMKGTRYGMSVLPDHIDNKDDFTNGKNPHSPFLVRNSFNATEAMDEEGNLLNANGDYTNTMNGTSSATPVTSGSIALILEANPKLTWRDVKHILASTATKVDADMKPVTGKIANDEDYTYEQGWVTNAAGYSFNNWYGFGRVNVASAVKMAKKYKLGSLGEYETTDLIPNVSKAFYESVPIPAGSTGLTKTISVTKNNANLSIETVRLHVSAIAEKSIGDLAVELTSPKGTKSIVWHAANAFALSKELKDMPIQTNAFYGENTVGTWSVKLINTGSKSGFIKLKGLQIEFAGHK